MGANLLGGTASLRSRRRVCELHDGERGARPDTRVLPEQLQQAGGVKDEIRSKQLLSGEPEYRPGRERCCLIGVLRSPNASRELMREVSSDSGSRENRATL